MKSKSNVIAKLRKEAGFTQKSLAEALHITDKAVSKWERGISWPDITLLPRLSALLDADIETLLKETASVHHHAWAGLIDLRKFDHDPAQLVYDKPLVYYLLSHYLLLGIREIYVLDKEDRFRWVFQDSLKKFGFCFTVNPERMPDKNVLIMGHPCFLFGSDLTRRFQGVMSTGKLTKLCPAWDMTPFLFCPAEYADMYYKDPAFLYENAFLRTLGRGMICLPLDTPDQLNDVSSFVRIYQQNTGLMIHDMHEVIRLKKQTNG